MKIQITADSTCDLGSQIEKHGIGIMPLSVILGYSSHLDGVNIVPQDIFDYVEKTGELPKRRRRVSGITRSFSENMSTKERRSFISIFPANLPPRTITRLPRRKNSKEEFSLWTVRRFPVGRGS